MVSNGVCAVIVTYHPLPDTISNIRKLRPQVQGLVVVDNGSSIDCLEFLRAASNEYDYELIENYENLGVGAALNIGARWAQTNGFRYLALFDQDSTVTDGFIETTVEAYESNSNRKRIGIIAVASKNRVTGVCPTPRFLGKDGSILVAMTSGSLLPIEVLSSCGYFQEDLIIDLVDYEYCLRLRDAGYIVQYCPKAFLLHSAGSPAECRLFGIVLLTFSNHSAARWYYITRNSILMLKRYGMRYPNWACATIAQIVFKGPIKTALVSEERWRKLYNILLGAVDGILGKKGARVGL